MGSRKQGVPTQEVKKIPRLFRKVDPRMRAVRIYRKPIRIFKQSSLISGKDLDAGKD